MQTYFTSGKRWQAHHQTLTPVVVREYSGLVLIYNYAKVEPLKWSKCEDTPLISGGGSAIQCTSLVMSMRGDPC